MSSQAAAAPKLVRHGQGELALEVGDRTLDLSEYLRRNGIRENVIDLFSEGWFTRAELDPKLAQDEWREVGSLGSLKTPIPSSSVGKILALGKNFREHAAEFNEEVPSEPLFFNKLPETLVPHDATVRVSPSYERRVDHESELAVLISRNGSCFAPEEANGHVAGYTVANDLTARSLQGWDRKQKFPWFRSKNMDGFCPLGPCLVPRDYLDISQLRITASVNGELRQDSNLNKLVVSVPDALSYLSHHLTLRAGDLILMGTPAGVGPLEDGDEVVCAIEGIGELRTRIARPPA